ncbi:MAG: SixA phosphatase family protein [Nocardioides sp.]
MAARTLILIRHGKSDWSGDHDDLDRPLAPRGIRQAREAGRWLAWWSESGHRVGQAVSSPARRATSTWELVAAELGYEVPAGYDDRVYTFAGRELLGAVRGLDDGEECLVLVGHNPALEQLVTMLTGESAPMPTSAIAVVELAGRWRRAGVDIARLTAWGRPPRA